MWQEGHIATAHGRFNHTCQYDNVYRQKIPTFYNRLLLPPLKIALAHGRSGPVKYMLLWAHPTQHPKWHLDQFSHFCTVYGRESLYFTWTTPSPIKIAPLHGASGPSSNTWFLGSTQVQNPNGILISSAIFAGLTIVTDRQTTPLYLKQ